MKNGQTIFQEMIYTTLQKDLQASPFYNPYFAFQEIVTSRAIAVNFGGESFHEAIITTKVVRRGRNRS